MQWNNITSYKKNYLPSKKIQYSILVIIIIGASYWAIPRIKEYYQTHRAVFSITGKPPAPLLATTPPPNSLDKDSDGDKVPDWQESLFGLNAEKKDSDDDGFPDQLPTIQGESIGNLITLPVLDKLTLAVYTKFQNTPSESITPEQVQAATSDQVLAQAQSIEDALKRYQTIDLNLGDSDKASIITYQETINKLIDTVPDGAIFAKNIQEKILKNTVPGKFEIDFLNQTITKLLVMQVPARLSENHLAFLNSTYYILQILQMPPSDDELNAYILSIIAQKNINVVSRTAGDINALATIYKTYD